MFDWLNGGLDFLERCHSLWRRATAPETTAQRFRRLFTSHGVAEAQIPRFFDHGLTLADVADDARLTAALTPAMLADAAALFAIRLEWLEGATDQIYDVHDFYKQPAEAEAFFRALGERSSGEMLASLLIAPPSSDDADSILVVDEPIGALGERQICRYHLLGGWVYGYWKCRAYLAACVASARRHHVYVVGYGITAKACAQLNKGLAFPVILDERSGYASRRWEAEDLTWKPDVFLKGINEPQCFDKALQLWLDLDDCGYMNTGQGSARAAFAAKLQTLSGNSSCLMR